MQRYRERQPFHITSLYTLQWTNSSLNHLYECHYMLYSTHDSFTKKPNDKKQANAQFAIGFMETEGIREIAVAINSRDHRNTHSTHNRREQKHVRCTLTRWHLIVELAFAIEAPVRIQPTRLKATHRTKHTSHHGKLCSRIVSFLAVPQ